MDEAAEMKFMNDFKIIFQQFLRIEVVTAPHVSCTRRLI